jgi:hypothetical protein
LNDLRDQKNDAQWRGGAAVLHEVGGWPRVVAGRGGVEKKPTGGGPLIDVLFGCQFSEIFRHLRYEIKKKGSRQSGLAVLRNFFDFFNRGMMRTFDILAFWTRIRDYP